MLLSTMLCIPEGSHTQSIPDDLFVVYPLKIESLPSHHLLSWLHLNVLERLIFNFSLSKM